MKKQPGDYDQRRRQDQARAQGLRELIEAHPEEFAVLLAEERVREGLTKPPRKTPARPLVVGRTR